MPSHGELGLKSRRISTPGANTNILYNKGGVDGADANLTYDYVTSNLNVAGNIFITGNNSYLAVRGQLPVAIAALGNSAPGGVYIGSESNGNLQTIQFFTANAAVDNAWWEIQAQNTGILTFRSANDRYQNITTWMQVRRANANSNIGTITLGNSNDLPNINLIGIVGISQNLANVGNIAVTQNISTGNIFITTNANTNDLYTRGNVNANGFLVVHGNFPGIAVLNGQPGGTYIGSQAAGNNQGIEFFTSNAAVDNAWWEILAQNTGILTFRSSNDTYGNVSTWMQVTRRNANANIGKIELGSSLDLPNILVSGNLSVTANIANTGNLLVTQNTFTGNLSVTTLANIAAGNISNFGVSQNGTVGVLGVSNINFNNTATIGFIFAANGANQANISAVTLGAAGGGGGVVFDDGTLVLGMSNANINFLTTSTANATATANGSTQANVQYDVNVSQVAINTRPIVSVYHYSYCGGV